MKKILIFLFFLFSFQALAAPPSWVYRGDKRPPDIIFKEGFRPYGENTNLMGHLTGMTSSGAVSQGKKATSNFVSTTSDKWVATEFAIRALDPGESGWLYTIRASEDFYPALESARHIASVHNHTLSPELNSILETEYEYSALGGITPSLIEIAEEYATDAMGNVTVVRTLRNPNFDAPTNSHANDSVYQGSDKDNYYDFSLRRIFRTNSTAGFALSEEDAEHTWILSEVLPLFSGASSSHSHTEL